MPKDSINISSGNKSDIFQSIADTIHHITSLPVSIWAPDPNKTSLRIVAAVGLPANYVQSASLDLNIPSVTGDAFKKKRIQITRDILSSARWYYKELAQEMNWKSAISVPVESDNNVIGVISVYAYRERSITELAYTLPAFAEQIGLTIKADKQNEVFQHILDIGEKLQSMTESPKEVLDAIVKDACGLTGADCAVIYPFDSQQSEFYDTQNIVSHGLQEPLNLPEKPRDKGGITSYVRRRGEVIVANVKNQSSTIPSTSSFIQRESIQAFMGVALKVTEDVVGLLFVNFRVPHVFTRHEKDTIRLFAHQAANALNNAKLYKRISVRIEALEKLHEAGISLTSIPAAPEDLKDTLMRIAQSARQVLGADLIELYQYDQSRDWYDLPPIQVGELYDELVVKDKIHKDDVICKIVRGRRPIYTTEAQKSNLLTGPFTIKRDDAPEQRFVIRENIKSSASIPLMAGTEVVGVLFANYRISQIFSLEQTRLIELFASQAAIAIRNARLFQQLHEYIQLLNGQMQALHAVAQKQTIEDVLEHVLIGINTIFGVNTSSSINLYDEAKNTFYAYQAAGPLKDYLLRVPPRTLGSGGTGRFIIETKTSLYLDDVRKPSKDTPTVRQESIDQDICSFAAIPLKRDKHVLGVLFVNSQKPIIFTDGIKGILELFASQAAIAIENNRLYEQRDRNIAVKQALNELTQKLTENIEVGEEGILELLHQSAGELMDTDNMYVALYDEQTDIVRFGLAFVDGRKVDLAKEEGWRPRKAGKGRTEEIIRTKKPIFIPTQAESKDWYNQPGREEYVGNPLPSWLGVPMLIGDKILGVIATYHPTQEYVYSGEDLTVLQAMANQVAIALDNARLYGKTNLRLNALVSFEQEITSAIRQGENKILELIHDQASQLMDTDNMYVALYDERTDIVRFGLAFVDSQKVNAEREKNWQPRKAGKGRTEEIIRTKKPIFISTLAESKEWYALQGHEEYVQMLSSSWIGVPMMIGNKVLGVIATYHPTQEYVYSGDDLAILQAIANQAAIALDSARSFESAQKRIIDQETINSIAQAISIKVGTGDLLQTIVTQIQENLDCTHCAIFLPEKLGDEVTLVSEYTQGKFAERIKSRRFKPGEGIAGWVFEHGETVIVPDTLQDKRYVPIREGGYVSHSLMAVPVKMNGETVGVISVDHNAIDRFDEDDCRLVETVAEHVSIALEKGRAYEEIDKLYQEARSEAIANRQLATLGSAMAAIEHRINNTLNIIAPNLNRLRKRVNINDPEINEILGIIDRNTRYTTQLLKRIQTPLQEVNRVDVDINSVVNDILTAQMFEWRSNSTNLLVKADIKLDERIPVQMLPEGQVTEVVQNLIQNAYRALDKSYRAKKLSGAELHVSTALEGDKITIRVKDNVPGGISKAIQQRLFIKPVPSKIPGEGTGLGLWLSKVIMASIGGDIRIESTGLLGTVMIVEILCESGKEKIK
jgi:GAF domain-containing protein